MTAPRQRAGIGAFPRALAAGLQWRLLLLWVLGVLLATSVIVWPVRDVLGRLFDHSVHASEWARGFHALPMFDAIFRAGREGAALDGAAGASAFLLCLLAPFLTGMIVARLRAPAGLGFGGLVHGGLGQYWRMVRLALWSLVPYGIAAGIAAGAFALARRRAETATLQAVADRGEHLALYLTLVLLVLAHAVMESARAHVAADPGLRSATRAFGRGVAMLVRHPLATLGMYLATSALGYALVLGIGMCRIHTTAVGFGGVALAFVLAQLLVVAMAWQRTARLHGLAAVARSAGGRLGVQTRTAG